MSLAYLAFIIPLITTGVLCFMYRKQTAWWEYLVVLLPSLILVFGIKGIMIYSNESDTEYLGDHVVYVQHYDRWDEWISKTCSYQTCSGTGSNRHCTTHYYDCSYRKDHPEYWVKVTSTGKELRIEESEYLSLIDKFKSDRQFVEMNRHYFQIDGDAQRYNYLGTVESLDYVCFEHDYLNKVKASSSVFKFETISDADVKRWKLFEYPEVSGYKQNPVLGMNVDAGAIQKINYINGYYGPLKQIHVFILVYKGQSYDVVAKQKSYWQGGNKNELIIYLGTDGHNNISWFDASSWMDRPEVTTRVKNFLAGQKTVDVSALADFMIPMIETKWHRKNFADFDYLTVEITQNQLMWLFLILVIYNVSISIWVVRNQYLN